MLCTWYESQHKFWDIWDLERACRAWLKSRLHAKVELLESSELSSLSLGCRLGIGCRERVKGFGGGIPSFLEGRLKPGLWVAFSSAIWQYRLVGLLPRQERGIASRRRLALLCCCTLPTGPTIECERKFEIYILDLIFLKTTFLVVVSYIDVGPRGPGAKQNRCFI